MDTNNTDGAALSIPPSVIEEKGNLGTDIVRGILATIVLTVLVSVIYPAIVWGIGQVAFNHQANGSLITDAKGNVIGSELIGQQFTLPQYFHGLICAAST